MRPRLAVWPILAVPLAFLLMGLVWTLEAHDFVSVAKPARATIVALEEKVERDGDLLQQPTMRYRLEDGTEAEGRLAIWLRDYNLAVGDQIDIRYDPSNPADPRLDNFIAVYGFGPIVIGFGVLFSGIVVWFLAEERREAERAPAWKPVEVQTSPAPPPGVAVRASGTQIAMWARRIPGWIYGVAMAGFSIFILLGLWIAVDAVSFHIGATRTRGEVVRLELDQRAPDRMRHYVVVRYNRADGSVAECRSHIPLGTYTFPAGTELDIYYSDDRPGEVRIAGFVSNWSAQSSSSCSAACSSCS